MFLNCLHKQRDFNTVWFLPLFDYKCGWVPVGMCAGEEEETESKFRNFLLLFYIVIHLYKECFETMTRSPLLGRIPITKILIIHRCTFLLNQLGAASCRRLFSSTRTNHNWWLIIWGRTTEAHPTYPKMGPTMWYHLCCSFTVAANCSSFPLRSLHRHFPLLYSASLTTLLQRALPNKSLVAIFV